MGLRASAGIMRRFVLWDTACNFNDVIQKFKNLKCLITGTSTLLDTTPMLIVV